MAEQHEHLGGAFHNAAQSLRGERYVQKPGQSEVLHSLELLERTADRVLRVKEEIEQKLCRVIAPAPEVLEGTAFMPMEQPRSEVGRRLAALQLRLSVGLMHLQNLNSRIEL